MVVMNVTEFTLLLNKPNAINDKQTIALEKVLVDFPYFQSARAMRLKWLYNQDSFRYNFELKKTAAYTTDRTVLFDYITSDFFKIIQKGLYEQKLAELFEIDVFDSKIVSNSIGNQIRQESNSVVQNESAISNLESETASENLQIGKPLSFSKDEKHSFQEWLQLSKIRPIVRENNEINEPLESEKIKKNELIDKFIESNPKIPSISKSLADSNVIKPQEETTTHLMTETLAKVYLEQKKYQKAIQAYQILILKYPEKSSLFANRISDIKILQQNNI